MNDHKTVQRGCEEKKLFDWKKYLIDENFDADVLKFQETNIDHDGNSIYIDKDIPRTRPNDPFLQDPENRKLFRRMALTYCASHNLDYTSGFLELMAPFFLLYSSGLSLEHCYACFACFIRKYFPQKLLARDRADWMKKYSLYIENLLAYHSSKTANILQNMSIDVSLFGYIWICTFFCLGTKLNVVYELLGQFFAEGDKYFFIYLFVATIIMKEDVIKEKSSPEEFGELISYLNRDFRNEMFETEDNITNIFKLARKLREETPITFENSLKQFYIQNEPVVEPSSILEIYPSEVVDFVLKKYPDFFKNKDKSKGIQKNQAINQKELEFKILDARYSKGRSPFPGAVLLPRIDFSERTDLILEDLRVNFSTSHKCILQSDDKGNDQEKQIVEYTTNLSKFSEMNHVSIIKRGFQGILEEMRRRNVDTTIIENRKLSFFEKIFCPYT